MQADGNGVARSGPDVMAELRRVAKVPIYGMSGNFLGLGLFGGMLFDNPTHAADVARRALQHSVRRFGRIAGADRVGQRAEVRCA